MTTLEKGKETIGEKDHDFYMVECFESKKCWEQVSKVFSETEELGEATALSDLGISKRKMAHLVFESFLKDAEKNNTLEKKVSKLGNKSILVVFSYEVKSSTVEDKWRMHSRGWVHFRITGKVYSATPVQ